MPGSAGFLKIERSADGACCLGALFVVNPRGEPLEFAYNRVTAPRPFLWRQADLRRHVERRFTASLLSVCTHQPRLLLCLADEAIAALRILVLQRRVEAGLVVVPAALVGQWRAALATWAPDLRVSTVRGPVAERAWQWLAQAHVYLISYETLREDWTASPQGPGRQRTWDVVVLDEAQRIKNRASDISRLCKQLRRRRAWASGSPRW